MISNDKVSIIVCTLGRSSLIDCLKSIYNQTYENIELIVVSPDEKVEKVIRDFSNSKFNIKFLLSSKASVSRQRNIGLKYASGKIVGFIDDDAVADKDWILYLIKHYDDKEVMCTGGKIVPKFLGKVPVELKNLPKEIFKGFLGETMLESEDSIVINQPLLWASNISFRKTVFGIIGEFDEELGKTSDKLLCEEEIDIQARILEKGYKIIYEPKSLVTHFIDAEKLTKDYFIRRSFWQGYSEMIKIRNYEKFRKALEELNTSQLDYINSIKLMELLFQLSTETNLEKNIEASYNTGRIMALSQLIRR